MDTNNTETLFLKAQELVNDLRAYSIERGAKYDIPLSEYSKDISAIIAALSNETTPDTAELLKLIEPVEDIISRLERLEEDLTVIKENELYDLVHAMENLEEKFIKE